MKKLFLLLFASILTFNSFAQKVDFINAPLNPVPDNSSVAQQNLKGDVFQSDFTNFTRDGKWFSYTNKISKVTLNASGMVIEEVNSLGSSHFYEYNTKGLRVKFTRGSHGESTLYTYDQNNRIIKEVYKHPSESWTIDYTYKQVKDVLIITVKQTGGNRPYEVEKHFKNGLEIQFQYKGKDARKYHYEFDKKGNWIKRLTHDVISANLIYEVDTRSIIYYDEYERKTDMMSVISENYYKAGTSLVPKLYINNKIYYTDFARFNNGYIFYDVLSKTYYIAREGYNSNNTVGQKHIIEKLLSGYETVLLYNGKTATIVESGKARQSFNDWKKTNYLGFMIVADSVANKSYAFGPFPAVSDNKIIALGGKDMMDEENKISYLLNHEKKAFFVFENGKNIAFNYVAVRQGDLSIVVGDSNAPKFITPSDKKRVENVISPGRYFDPAKDKILTKNLK